MPLPVPLPPEVMVIHDWSTVALQVQELSLAVSDTEPVPPAPGTDAVVGERVKEQATAGF